MQQLSTYSWCGLQPASSPPSCKKYCSLLWATRDKTRPDKQLSSPRSLPTSSPVSEISATPGPRTSLPTSSTHVVSPFQTASLDNWSQDSQAEEQLIPPDSSLSAAHQFICPLPPSTRMHQFLSSSTVDQLCDYIKHSVPVLESLLTWSGQAVFHFLTDNDFWGVLLAKQLKSRVGCGGTECYNWSVTLHTVACSVKWFYSAM